MSTYVPTSVPLTPYDIPDDGDDVDASSVNIGLEALGDGVKYVGEVAATEVLRATAAELAIAGTLADETARAIDAETSIANDLATLMSTFYLLADVRYAAIAFLPSPISVAYGDSDATLSLLSSAGFSTIVGDVVEATFAGTGALNKGAGGTLPFKVQVSLNASQNGGASAAITGASQMMGVPKTASQVTRVPFSVVGCFLVTTPGTLAISAAFHIGTGETGDSIDFGVNNGDGAYSAVYRVWRRTDALVGGGGLRTVTSISPTTSIVVGGDAVTITGTNFGSATSATIGGTPITSFAVVNSTTITGILPAGTVGAKTVAVSGGSGGTATLASAITYKQWTGANHNTYSQSTYAAGAPSAGTNYWPMAHSTLDWCAAKGMTSLRVMFTWEWLQDTLLATIPGTGAYLAYWNAFVESIEYATSLGIQVTIGHYGWSTNFYSGGGGNTTPSWKSSGSNDNASYTNQIGGGSVTNAHFVDLWTQLANYFKTNPRVSYDLVNEPHDMSTMQWFATAQACITAIRATGSTQWIHIQGNGYATYQVTTSSYDSAVTKRSNAYGWANANGVGSPLTDPLNRLVATCHMYMDDAGGSADVILGYNGGTATNAAADRLQVMLDWAIPLGYKVHVGEIGFWAGISGAPATWAAFVAKCKANSAYVTGWNWWGMSEPGQWNNVMHNNWSLGTPSADSVNMNMIENDFAP